MNLDPADAKLLFKKVAQEVDLNHTGPNKRCKLEECLLSCPFAHHLLHPHYYMIMFSSHEQNTTPLQQLDNRTEAETEA